MACNNDYSVQTHLYSFKWYLKLLFSQEIIANTKLFNKAFYIFIVKYFKDHNIIGITLGLWVY